MHGPHDWNHPRDWSRFERRMRAWGRMFERDMRRMGAQMERDMGGERGDDADKPRGGRSDSPWSDAYVFGMGCSPGWRAHMAERQARRAARRAARHAARHARAGARAMACGPGGLWAWWWVVFPLFFLGKNAFEDAGGFTGLSTSLQGSLLSMLDLTPAGPLAHLLARATGMTFTEAFGVLAVAGVISAGAALAAWRIGRPSRVFEPS